MTEGNSVTEVENEDVVESVLFRPPPTHRRHHLLLVEAVTHVDIIAAAVVVAAVVVAAAAVVVVLAVAISEEEGVEPSGVGVSVALAPVAEATLHDPVEVIAVIVTALARVVAEEADDRRLPLAANEDGVVIAAGPDLLLQD